MAYRDDVLALSPVVYWRLGESSGTTANDETANGYDGTISGSVTLGATGLLTGDADTAMSAAAGSEKIEHTGATLPTGTSDAWSIAFWHKTSSLVSLSQVFGFGQQLPGASNSIQRYVLQFNSNYYFWGGGADWDTGVAFHTDGARHFVVFTCDGSNLRLYVDGSLAAGPQAKPSYSTANGYITAFSKHSGASTSANMVLDECAIFSSALSSTNVSDLYASGTGGGGSTYTLTADAGSFTLSGQAASLKADRKLTAAQGSFTLTGQAANLLRSHVMPAGVGAFTLTGNDANLIKAGSYTLTAEAGDFTLTGQASNLIASRKIAAAVGSFTLTGIAAGLKAARRLVGAVGSYVLTGQSATLTYTQVEPPTVTSVRFNNAEMTSVIIEFSEAVSGHSGFMFEQGSGMGGWIGSYSSGDPGTSQIWTFAEAPALDAYLEYFPGNVVSVATGAALEGFDNLEIEAFVGVPTQADIGWTGTRLLHWTAPNRRLEWTAQ